DPPNATISVLNSDGSAIEDAVVVLKKPKLDGRTLTFDVTVLEGGLSKADGPASLFIDWFAARVGRGGVVGGVGWDAAGWDGGWWRAGAGVAWRLVRASWCCIRHRSSGRSSGGGRILSSLCPAALRLLSLPALLLKSAS